MGQYDYLESHAIISDKNLTHIHGYCDFSPNATLNPKCCQAMNIYEDVVDIDQLNIYAPVCTNQSPAASSKKIW